MASFLEENDRLRDDLKRRFPGWNIWYVPNMNRQTTWCAQPYPLINAGSPEQLAADITETHESAAAEWPALANRADYAASAPGVRQPPASGGGQPASLR